jgi:hypothetical protein
MYGNVLGVTTTTAAALVLPNTGSNRALMAVTLTSLVVGVAITATSLARMVAKKAHKA